MREKFIGQTVYWKQWQRHHRLNVCEGQLISFDHSMAVVLVGGADVVQRIEFIETAKLFEEPPAREDK